MATRLDRLEARVAPALADARRTRRDPAEEARRQEARASLLPFVQYTMPGYEANWHHELLSARLDRWAATPGDRLIVCMPPQHGKSELISRRLPAFLLGRDPDAPVMLCSYGASLANRLNRQSRRIVGSESYRQLFPGTRLPRTGKDEGARAGDLWEVANRSGSLRSAGVGGGITGMGFRYGIIDDPVKGRKAAESDVERETCWDWYTGDFFTRRSPDSRILVVATRWHEDDLVGRLLRQQADDPKADRWDTLILPAIAGDTPATGDGRQSGEALWPERYPLADLAKVRAQSESDWWSLYQQDPRRGARSEWPASHFDEHVLFADWPPQLVRAIAVDPSKGQVDRPGDYCAFIEAGYDGLDIWAEATLERLPPEGIVERTLDLCERFRPDVVPFEANLFQSLFCVLLARRSRERKIPCPVVPVVNTVPKNVRIRRLGPYFAGRHVHIRATPGGRLLLDQLRQFPKSSHDDGPDALEMAHRGLVELWNGKQGGG